MKTNLYLASNLHNWVFRACAPSSPCGSQGMVMVPKSFFHRLHPISIILSSRHVNSPNRHFSSSSVSNCFCSRTELVQNFGIIRTYTTKSSSSTKPKSESSSSKGRSKSLTETSAESGAVTLSLGEKVKENAKTGGYGVVILLGIAVTGAMLWFILSELFSSDSPNNIYTHAYKLCKISPEVQDALGTPIKCHGEETRRGWRRHVSHVEFFQGNTKYLRMRFYIEGPFNKGTVHLEKKKTDQGKYEYSYLMVDIEGYPPRRIDVHF